MSLNSVFRLASAAFAVALAVAAPARAAEAEARASIRAICMAPGETREAVKLHRLIEPFAALKSAQAQYKGEPLTARLCRLGDEYIYEIALLRRDGRYVHAVMNAATGKWLEVRRSRETAAKQKEETATKPKEETTTKPKDETAPKPKD